MTLLEILAAMFVAAVVATSSLETWITVNRSLGAAEEERWLTACAEDTAERLTLGLPTNQIHVASGRECQSEVVMEIDAGQKVAKVVASGDHGTVYLWVPQGRASST